MIDKNEIKHIAGLARIGLDEDELDKYSQELSGILDWVKKLEEVDTENVEPTDHITGLKNIAKEDSVDEFVFGDDIKKLFPENKDGYNKVKAVL